MKLSLYTLEPRGSHRHCTGQNEVSLEPHSPHEGFEISHAQIGQLKSVLLSNAFYIEIYYHLYK